METDSRSREHHILTLNGELDISTRDDLRQQLEASGALTLTVDLGDVTFIDATCLGELVRTANRLHASGGGLVLVGVSPSICRTMDLMALGQVMAITAAGPAVVPKYSPPAGWVENRSKDAGDRRAEWFHSDRECELIQRRDRLRQVEIPGCAPRCPRCARV